MEADRGSQGHAAARQLERHHAAETETDRRNPLDVDTGLLGEHVVAGRRQLADRRRVVEELAEPRLRVREWVLAAAAEVVERKRDIAARGEPLRTVPHVVVLTSALVHQQHRGPVAVTGLAIDGEVADHLHPAGLVRDPLGVPLCAAEAPEPTARDPRGTMSAAFLGHRNPMTALDTTRRKSERLGSAGDRRVGDDER